MWNTHNIISISHFPPDLTGIFISFIHFKYFFSQLSFLSNHIVIHLHPLIYLILYFLLVIDSKYFSVSSSRCYEKYFWICKNSIQKSFNFDFSDGSTMHISSLNLSLIFYYFSNDILNKIWNFVYIYIKIHLKLKKKIFSFKKFQIQF